MSKPFLKVTSDFTKQFNETIAKFRNDAVLVGIPQENGKRKPELGEEAGPIGNAALLAIANFGSAANNIPPWPIMAIGIKNAQAGIVEQLRAGAKLALSQGFSAIDTYYNRAGIIASTAIKKVINSQEGVPPNKPSEATMAARKSDGFKGSKYWLRTGQMRNAITYVIQGNVGGKKGGG